MDPSVGIEKDDIVFNKHRGTIDQLSSSLSCIITDLFTGWLPKFTSTNFVVLRTPGIDENRLVLNSFELAVILYSIAFYCIALLKSSFSF